MLGKNRRTRTERGQTMVEFAMTLPIILTLVFGIIEFGWLLWSYSSVNSAAREAARYGITIGPGEVAGQRYYDCEGIKEAAMRAGSFAGMEVSDVVIHYDNGPVNAAGYVQKYTSCEDLASHAGDDEIVFGDRIVVSVLHDYQPIAAMIGFNIEPFNMIARSNRTIVKNAEVVSSGDGSGGGGGTVPCFTFYTTHVGDGADPGVSPSQSSGCNLGEYVGGEIITLTGAIPDSGWSVAYWSGTELDISTSTSNTVNMPGADHIATVTYINTTPTCHLLSYSQTGTGTGTLSRSPASSTGCSPSTYTSGETIQLNAVADVGSTVKGWTGTPNDGDTTGSNSIVMPDANKAVTVDIDLLSPICYSLTLNKDGEGSTPSATAANCAGGEYAEGTTVILNATPAYGYEISGWTGTDNDASTSTSYVEMTEDKNVTVHYVISTPPEPPLNVYIPNGDGEWKWQNGQKECQQIDLRWSANASWEDSPLYYEVFNLGTSHGGVFGTYWDANQAVDSTFTVDLGVRAVFTGGVTSVTQYVQYLCRPTELVPWSTYTVQ